MSTTLTRVEGEGEIHVYVRDGEVLDVEVRITEAPRFFEYIVVGRRAVDVPDIMSRICGFCGISYILTAIHAFERGAGIEVSQHVEVYRRALHAAERVKSHMLHAYFMHLPDLINAKSPGELYERNPALFRSVTRILEWVRKAMSVLGGRFHNVVNLRVGGVYGYPRREDVAKLARELSDVERSLLSLMDFTLSLDIPSYRQGMKLLALYDGSAYPEYAGRVAVYSNGELELYDLRDFEKMIIAEQKPYSNALRYRLVSGEPYCTGPLARFNIGYKHLRGEVRDKLEEYGWKPPLVNIHQSIVARLAEVYNTLLFMKEFAESYSELSGEGVEYAEIPQGEYLAAVEAPRGTLYHRYVVDSRGRVSYANIITPTAQNLALMEKLIREEARASAPITADLILEKGSRIVRSFDPCISCSVHTVRIHEVKAHKYVLRA